MDSRDSREMTAEERKDQEMRALGARVSPLSGQPMGYSGYSSSGSSSDSGPSGEELSLDNIELAMHYQPWSKYQAEQGDQVREALVLAAKAILRNVPRSPRRTLALQHLISARMDANCAISFGGRF